MSNHCEETVLPNETLSEIFTVLQDIDPPVVDLDALRLSVLRRPNALFGLSDYEAQELPSAVWLGWIRVTFVSRRWRMVALSNPSLWTGVPLRLGRQWADAYVDRSRPMPLNLVVSALEGLRKRGSWMDNFLLANLPRARSLIVDYPSDCPLDHTLLEQTCDFLETIHLRTQWAALPSRLSILQSSKLRTLSLYLAHLDGDDFPWQDMHIDGLQALRLLFARPVGHKCYDSFMSAMQRSPSLEEFELSCRVRDDPRSTSSCTCVTSVPRPRWDKLRRLSLKMNSSAVLHILGHIAFPATAKLHLTSHGSVRGSDFERNLIPLLTVMSSARPYKKLFLSDVRIGELGTRLLAARSDLTLFDKSGLINPDLDLSVPLDPGCFHLFPDILASLGPDTLRILDVCVSVEGASSVLLDDLRLLRRITHVRVIRPVSTGPAETPAGTVIGVLRLLLIPLAASQTPIPPPLPQVVELDLSNLDLDVLTSRYTAPGHVGPHREMPPTFAQALADLLQVRRDLGARIQRVLVREHPHAATLHERQVLSSLRGVQGVTFVHKV